MDNKIMVEKTERIELDVSSFESSVSVSFRSYPDDKKLGFANVTYKNAFGGTETKRLTVWKNRDGSPRIGWIKTYDGYTTSVYKPTDPEKSKFINPSEGSIDSMTKSIIDYFVFKAVADVKQHIAPKPSTKPAKKMVDNAVSSKDLQDSLEEASKSA